MKKSLLLFAIILSLGIANAQIVNVTDDITSNTTWTANNTYVLDGLIFVDSTYTLTIEPGTVIKGKEQANITTGDGASALIIRRGGYIIANGTKENPIVMTSELDDLGSPSSLEPTDRGLWGGLILLGSAVTNEPGNNTQIEGIPSEIYARFGGENDQDSSGVLRYISIRHGGFSISGVAGDEINGLTLGAIGSKTVIEYIEVFANLDDGYEWFGGTVKCKYLVAAFCGDDCFDWDFGFRGLGQFWFGLQNTDESGRGMEMDGGDTDEGAMPFSIPTVSNITLIGSGATTFPLPSGEGNDRALYFRDNSGGHLYNAIITDFTGTGITVEDLGSGADSRERLEQGDLTIENVYWWDFGVTNALDSVVKQDFVRTYLTGTGSNLIADPMLANISREQMSSLDPRPLPSSPVVTGAMIPSDPFFTTVSYLGAFEPSVGLWTEGWTALSQDGITSVKEESYSNTVPQSFNLSQNFPNPFNPTTRIKYDIKESGDVTLVVHNILGQKVAELVNNYKEAGSYTVVFDAESLPSGLYIYTLEAGATKISKKMTLLK
jgi:hypothetical protein